LRILIGKSFLTSLDQALVSGSNFLLSIMLARWLMPAQYGAYTLAFELFLLVALLHQALLLEPMSVLGPSMYSEQLKPYFRNLLSIHLALSLTIGVALGTYAWIVDKPGRLDGLPAALVGIALAGPCILLLQIGRRAFYWELTPGLAVAATLLYCVLVVSGLIILYRLALLTSFTALLLMGTAALLASAFQLIRLQRALKPATTATTLHEVWSQHWKYGRWAIASSLAIWIPGNIYFILLGSFSGMAKVGALKALWNLTQPIAQVFTALSLFFLPYAARVGRRSGSASVGRLAWKLTFVFAGASISYWSVIVLLREKIVHLLYAGHFGEIIPWVPWIAVYMCLWCATHAQAIGLRALLSPASVFCAYGVASIVSVAIGIPAVHMLGIPGAIGCLILSSGICLATIVLLLRHKIHHLPASSPDAPAAETADDGRIPIAQLVPLYPCADTSQDSHLAE
jgi:O-antigen/teichoic acid export membrane protein